MVHLLSNMAHITPLSFSSYNCCGFNKLKSDIIADLCVRTDFVFLQEHWMTAEQLGELGLIRENVGLINRLLLQGGPTVAAQFCGSLQYLLMSCLYLLTVDVKALFTFVLAMGNHF